jgi:hypothetical protein
MCGRPGTALVWLWDPLVLDDTSALVPNRRAPSPLGVARREKWDGREQEFEKY